MGSIIDNYTAYTGKLTNPELNELSIHLDENTYRTVEEISIHIEATYDESYSLSGLTSLLHNLGFVYKKPKRTPGKSDIEKQQEFIKQYKKIKAKLEPEDNMYFLDATHPNHSSVSAMVGLKKAL